MSIGRTGRTRLLGSGLSSLVSSWQTRSFVRSVQRGTVTIANGQTTGTATITSVVTANAWLSCLESKSASSGADTSIDARAYLALTNSTTITATRVGTDAACTVGFDIIEFVPGVLKSVQRGSIFVSDVSASATATVTAVDTTKALLSSLGQVSNIDVATLDQIFQWTMLTLTNATTVTCSRIGSGAAVTMTQGYQLAEFF